MSNSTKPLYFVNLASEIQKGKDGHVASVAVIDGDKILMGKRRDNEKWTLPGGHMEQGESKEDGAIRELAEESGITREKKDLKHLGSKKLTTFTGQEKTIHAFTINHDGSSTTMRNDPDQEVHKWHWVDKKEGLPEHIKENLHSPKNLVLQKLKLIKGGSMEFFVKGDDEQPQGASVARKISRKIDEDPTIVQEHPEYSKYQGAEQKMRDDATATRKENNYSKPGIRRHQDDDQEKSFQFVIDLIKGVKGQTVAGHRYLRRYQRGGKWIYVYHEGEAHGREIKEEAVNHIKTLAESGHEHSKKLIETLQSHNEEKLKILRQLADSGHEESHGHLKTLGINRKQERMEEKIIPAQVTNKDKLDQEVPTELRSKAIQAVKDGILAAKTHLDSHMTSAIASKIHPTLASGELNEMISGAKTPREILDATAKIAHKLEDLQGSIEAQRPGEHKTYGNMIYNDALKRFAEHGLITRQYAEDHKRSPRIAATKHMSSKEHEAFGEQRTAREEAVKVAREARERAELAEIHGSMAHHMSTISSSSMSVDKIKELNTALKNIFGKQLSKADWPYHFEGTGMKPKIVSVRVSGGNVQLDMQVYDSDGNPVMDRWQRTFTKINGRPDIHNDYMKVNTSARGTVQIGNLINQGQRELMKSLPRGGTISVYAALDVGGYNWANQGFSFDSEDTTRSYRANFQRFLAEKNIHLTDADMMKFKDPVHFAAFTDGKKYEKRVEPMKLSQQQIETGSLAGVQGENKLTPEEIRSGKTNRMLCHLGKLFMLGRSWNGTWDSAEQTPASKYAEKYYQLRERASKVLEPEYNNVAAAVASGERTRAAPRPAVQSRESVMAASGATGRGAQLINSWTRPGIPGTRQPAIRMTKQRVERFKRLPVGDMEHFISNARLTPAARRQLRTAMAEVRSRSGS